MKKLITICLLIAATCSVKAQQKPTKEQTINFIKGYYEEKSFTCELSRTNDSRAFNVDDNFLIEFDNSTMTISWRHTYTYIHDKETDLSHDKVSQNKAKINLSKIELISFSGFTRGNCTAWSAKLVASYGNKIELSKSSYMKSRNNGIKKDESTKVTYEKEINIPINVCDDCDPNVQYEKILKAFNHLRKLCGAPEPIKF
jgi:hypothetical protein